MNSENYLNFSATHAGTERLMRSKRCAHGGETSRQGVLGLSARQ